MSTVDTQEQFIEMRANNESYASIATKLGVSKTTLIKWAKEYEYEIHNQRSLNMDALQEQYKMGRKYRIEMLAGRLEKLQAEVEKRDLSEVPTYKLYEMIDRTVQALEREETPFIHTEVSDAFHIEPLVTKTHLSV
jgi:transposase